MKKKIAFGMILGTMLCFCGCGNKDYSASLYMGSDDMYASSDYLSSDYISAADIPANGVWDVNDPVEFDNSPSLDVSGCTSLDDVINNAMLDDMGYAKVTVSGEDLLLACSRTVDNGGIPTAINATAYRVNGKTVEEVGCIYSVDGLRQAGGKLYAYSDTEGTSYSFQDDYLVYDETVWCYDDEDTKKTEYFHSSYIDPSDDDNDCDKATFDAFIDQCKAADYIEFTVVHKIGRAHV